MRHCLAAGLLSVGLLLAGCGDREIDSFEGERRIHLVGEVPSGPETHFFLPFDVPAGVAEIEVRHDDLSPDNILDWGLDDPMGFRGWGGGKFDPSIVGVRAASPSYVPGPLPVGTWEVVVGKAKINDLPGRYDVEVILRDTPTLPAQTEREPFVEPPALEVGGRWYTGDFHSHTIESDGTPTIDELISFAESRGLDFLLMSEHNTVSQLSWYPAAQRDTDVLLLPGMEFTTYAGHANTIGTTEWFDHRIGVRGAVIEDAIADAHAQGGLFSINHPLLNVGDLCIGCGWQLDVDPTTIDAVEVWGTIFSGITFWDDLLERGSHAVALGGSDDHRGGQGEGALYTPLASPTTMVWAEELSVEGILQGLRDGHTVVKIDGPDGPMIETDLTGEGDGDTVVAAQASLRARVTSAAGLTLRIWKNGAAIADVPIDSDPFVHAVDVLAPSAGEDRYRHEVIDGETLRSVASHVWLRRP